VVYSKQCSEKSSHAKYGKTKRMHKPDRSIRDENIFLVYSLN